MRLLALDAATEACSVALWQDGLVVERYEESGRSASERLMELVREVLSVGQIALRQLDGVAASLGPGGFTGVRVTVSVAQGLAFGAGLPAVGVSTLEALAAQVLSPQSPRALCCLDARMQELYWALFDWSADGLPVTRDGPAVGPAASVPPPAGGALGIGRGFAAYPALRNLPGVCVSEPAAQALPRAAQVAQLGAARLRGGGGLDPAALQPVYLRDKVAFTEAERAARATVI